MIGNLPAGARVRRVPTGEEGVVLGAGDGVLLQVAFPSGAVWTHPEELEKLLEDPDERLAAGQLGRAEPYALRLQALYLNGYLRSTKSPSPPEAHRARPWSAAGRGRAPGPAPRADVVGRPFQDLPAQLSNVATTAGSNRVPLRLRAIGTAPSTPSRRTGTPSTGGGSTSRVGL
jgi:hypothetical protein